MEATQDSQVVEKCNDVLNMIDTNINLLLLNDDMKVAYFNEGFSRIFESAYGIRIVVGIDIIDALHVVNQKASNIWRDRLIAVRLQKLLLVEELFQKDGKTYFWEVQFKLIPTADKSYISLCCRDATFRRTKQSRIKKHEANLRAVLNSIDNGICLVNNRGEIIEYNCKFFSVVKDVLGGTLRSGEKLLEYLPQGLRNSWLRRCKITFEGNAQCFLDSFVVGRSTRHFEIRAYPIMENNEFSKITISTLDITNIREAETQLKLQNEELGKINGELDRFVYSASHDLRAPLMSIKGLVNIIRLDQRRDNLLTCTSFILKSIDRLDKFVVDIVNYSRNSRVGIGIQKVDFPSLLNKVIESVNYIDGFADVDISADINNKSPFFSDFSRLFIIFNSIVCNSIQYRDRWKKSFLKISIDSDSQKVIIRFEDNGIGISEMHQMQLFQMFFRASSDSKGPGLGLYIVKSVTEKLNGKVRITSKLGEGTTVQVEIPNSSGQIEI